jgi:hypothetical protein
MGAAVWGVMGKLGMSDSAVPAGLAFRHGGYPAINRWAIFGRSLRDARQAEPENGRMRLDS